MLFQQLRAPVFGFVLLLLVGTVGYSLIEGWSYLDSLWMVTITISTVGYGEVHSLSPEGRGFTIGLIGIGIMLGAYTATEVTRFVAEGALLESLRARRLRKDMKHMKDHFIVVGYGRLGREVTAELTHRGRKVVIIESHAPEENLEFPYIQGDGTSDEVLDSAQIKHAQGLAVCTGNDAANVFITLSARQLNPGLQIVTRVDDQGSVQKALRAGANAVLNPYGIGGARVAQGLMHPTAATLVDRTMGRAHDELEMEDILVGEGAEGGTLREMRVSERFKILVVAIRKSDGRFQSGFEGTSSLEANDTAVVVGRGEDIHRFAVQMRDPSRA